MPKPLYPVFPPKFGPPYRGYRNRMAICVQCKKEKEFYASHSELSAGPVCVLCECGPTTPTPPPRDRIAKLLTLGLPNDPQQVYAG